MRLKSLFCFKLSNINVCSVFVITAFLVCFIYNNVNHILIEAKEKIELTDTDVKVADDMEKENVLFFTSLSAQVILQEVNSLTLNKSVSILQDYYVQPTVPPPNFS